MEPQQVELYIQYGLVIAHNNTAKMNIYGLSLLIFVIVDNNYSTRPVAQAFLNDKTLESYLWSLKVILQAYGIYLTVMITDADPAMDVAIAQIYSQTRHLHCIWHIDQNIPKNLKSKLHDDYEEFAKKFFQYHNKLSIENFEHDYIKLIEDYPNVKGYLKRLYESKES
ncbi:12028_t:CDS:1 [Funneliformis geosporum]|nr:12028_t:CDS:1 [Funneliformis geosporum]